MDGSPFPEILLAFNPVGCSVFVGVPGCDNIPGDKRDTNIYNLIH
jgi:hypothetical protein